ncbi:hypothetical protein KHA99_19860 [Bacillus sp. FJAT-49825]|uniref:UGSC-like domain-containing protein n=2 Tax=Neobacillus rhizophilus TaxID=2833579 RepID=A0A942YW90_9BACI|nr:hypothetical protein [Neobacillus rhizophilus]
MKIMNPVASPKKFKRETTKVSTLAGKNIGLLDNGWPSWNFIINEIEKTLTNKYHVKKVTKWNIPLSNAAPAELIEEIAEVSDICIVGLGN